MAATKSFWSNNEQEASRGVWIDGRVQKYTLVLHSPQEPTAEAGNDSTSGLVCPWPAPVRGVLAEQSRAAGARATITACMRLADDIEFPGGHP
jgi:hypothetical protein